MEENLEILKILQQVDVPPGMYDRIVVRIRQREEEEHMPALLPSIAVFLFMVLLGLNAVLLERMDASRYAFFEDTYQMDNSNHLYHE
jgi:hypothetical protein